jgi:hypothetical protein
MRWYHCVYCWRVYLTPWHLWRRVTGGCETYRAS